MKRTLPLDGYDLSEEAAVAASDAASFMQSADMDMALPPEDDPGCGGCDNSEHCGFCPCCAPLATVEREDLLAALHEAHAYLVAVEEPAARRPLHRPLASSSPVDASTSLHIAARRRHREVPAGPAPRPAGSTAARTPRAADSFVATWTSPTGKTVKRTATTYGEAKAIKIRGRGGQARGEGASFVLAQSMTLHAWLDEWAATYQGRGRRQVREPTR